MDDIIMADIVMADESQERWLVDWLKDTLDTNHHVRSTAEAKINQSFSKPGFGTALCDVFANKDLPVEVLHQASSCFKSLIIPNWGIAVSSEEKEVIRRSLLSSLNNSHGNNYSAISTAAISINDCDWPDFITLVIKMLDDSTEIGRVHEALNFLALLYKNINEEMVPILLPALFPPLLSIVSASQAGLLIYNKCLRGKALWIVHSCTLTLSTMSDVYRGKTMTLMSPLIKTWMALFAIIMKDPLQSKEPDDWSLRMEVLKCLMQFVQNFPVGAEREFMVIKAPLWQTSVSSLKVYEQSAIKGDEGSDETKRSLISYITELLGFLLTIVGNRRFVKVVEDKLHELAYAIFGFLQMTEQQVKSWSQDVNQYVADENPDNYSCRICGIHILEEIVSSYGEAGLIAIISAGREQFKNSRQEKVEGSKCWWKIIEALIYGLASLSEKVAKMEVLESTSVDLRTVIDCIVHLVTEDYETGLHENQFLHARVFSSMPKFSFMIKREVSPNCLLDAMSVIPVNVPTPVKIGACRALSQLLPVAENESSELEMTNLVSSLATFLLEVLMASKEASHKSGGEATAAKEVLIAIENAPGCIGPLVYEILPRIEPILSYPKQRQEGLVARSLDLITMLLKNSSNDIMKSIYVSCFDPIVKIVIESDDHIEIQNATECLALFVYGGRKELLAWDAVSGSTMKRLQDAFTRLLDFNLENSGSFVGGKYILQLILHLPSQMSQHTPDLYHALLRQMNIGVIAGFKIFSLLADTLIEIQGQATNAEDEINSAKRLMNFLLDKSDTKYLEYLHQRLTEPQQKAVTSLQKELLH